MPELAERIRYGHSMLCRITGTDYGYDLSAWQARLKVSREGGYTWNRNIGLPRIMKDALASEAWREAVSILEEAKSRRKASRHKRAAMRGRAID